MNLQPPIKPHTPITLIKPDAQVTLINVILENTWTANNEADDIIDYCINHDIQYKIMTPESLFDMDHAQFFNSIYFCDTAIVQYHLRETNCSYLIPDTYESVYNEFYSRKIEQIRWGDVNISILTNPIFIKPIGNSKSFDGTIITTESDNYSLQLVSNKSPNTIIYKSDVVNFICEYRLLIGNGKLYGYGFIRGRRMESFTEELNITKIIELTGENFRCIDIGFVMKPLFKWIIIEVNPAFSLDDYDIPIQIYLDFCIDSCKWINSYVNKTNNIKIEK